MNQQRYINPNIIWTLLLNGYLNNGILYNKINIHGGPHIGIYCTQQSIWYYLWDKQLSVGCNNNPIDLYNLFYSYKVMNNHMVYTST